MVYKCLQLWRGSIKRQTVGWTKFIKGIVTNKSENLDTKLVASDYLGGIRTQ